MTETALLRFAEGSDGTRAWPQGRPGWDGGVWEAYLPWAPACVLLSCAEDIPDQFFAE